MSNVRDFGASGKGTIDDTEAILHAVKDGDGVLEFPPGNYRITRTIPIVLAKTGRSSIVGVGGTAKIIMAGAGPAFHLLGTHTGTAHPPSFKPPVWQRERMPTVLNLEIEGAHPEADGVRVDQVMQATFEGLLLRELRTGIHVVRRARNVLISHCHIYGNRNVGVLFDHVNLHQAIIASSHISYNAKAGIQIVGGEIRNVQITGNDIEYNFRDGVKDSADILIDCRPDGATINEGTISSNTIQARISPNGANVRMLGNPQQPEQSAGMFTITGNLIGTQAINIDLQACRSVTIEGNVLYSASDRNLNIDRCRNIVIGPNCIDRNTDGADQREISTGVRITRSRAIVLSGLQIQDSPSGQHKDAGAEPREKRGLLEITDCDQVNATGLQLLDGVPHGLAIETSRSVNLSGCSILEQRTKGLMQSAIRWTGNGTGNLMTGCTLSEGTQGATQIGDDCDVEVASNRGV